MNYYRYHFIDYLVFLTDLANDDRKMEHIDDISRLCALRRTALVSYLQLLRHFGYITQDQQNEEQCRVGEYFQSNRLKEKNIVGLACSEFHVTPMTYKSLINPAGMEVNSCTDM